MTAAAGTPIVVVMDEVLIRRARALLAQDRPRSIFRCPECGSHFDAPRENPETGGIARKCLACDDWYPVVGARPRTTA
jgi:hypothetical protein